MRIAVLGAGGVGGYYGGRLALAGYDVHLIARGAHLNALRANGLRVHSVRGDFQVAVPATDDPAEIGPCDVVLFCVKAYDTALAGARLGPLLREGTAVVSLQNGIDNEERLAGLIGWHHVLGGAAYIFAEIDEPGVIAHTGGPASIAIGEFDGLHSDRVAALAAACAEAGVPCELPSDIRVALWSKYAFICAAAGMTAATRLPIGEIRASRPALDMFRSLVVETVAVGRSAGVDLPDTIVDAHLRLATDLPFDARSSLYHDLVSAHRMELDALHGTLVRIAAANGVPAPAASAVYALLSPWAAKFEHAA
jgi:2-dehydropantoate 2-reductase